MMPRIVAVTVSLAAVGVLWFGAVYWLVCGFAQELEDLVDG